MLLAIDKSTVEAKQREADKRLDATVRYMFIQSTIKGVWRAFAHGSGQRQERRRPRKGGWSFPAPRAVASWNSWHESWSETSRGVRQWSRSSSTCSIAA